MLHEGIPRFGPRPMDARGFVGVMMRHALTSPEEERTFHDPSFAIVSDRYLNFTSRVGYHFSALDTYCGDTVSKNYISFRFKGGAAEYVRRSRRVRAISEILLELGFTVDVKGDLFYARMQKYDREQIGQGLEVLGRLFQFSRQLDLAMISEQMVGFVRDSYLAGNYTLDPDFPLPHGVGDE
jgi:pyruvate,water dikinase